MNFNRSRCSVALLAAVTSFALLPLLPARAETPAPAATLVAAAGKRAATGKKNVLVVFHASWCGWCKRLEKTVLDDPEMGKLVTANYEVVRLDVQENGPAKSQENPGGGDLMAKLGGAKSGLPFYAVLDPKGNKLSDSNALPGGQNIGYPGSPQEITAFMGVIQKGAPRLSAADSTRLADHLKKNAPQ